MSEDFALDFHSKYVSTNAITKTSQFGNIANSEQVHKLYDVTGRGVTIAVMDTGVDFSNPDIRETRLGRGGTLPEIGTVMLPG